MAYVNPFIQQAYNLGTTLGMGIAQRDADRRQREIDEKIRAQQMSRDIGNFNANTDYTQMIKGNQGSPQAIDYTKIGQQNNGNVASVPSANQANSNNPYAFTVAPNQAQSMLQTAPTIDDQRRMGNQIANFTQGEAKPTYASDLTDPNYKNDLWSFLRSQGYGSDDINAYITRTNLDERIKNAKAQELNDGYYSALASGQPLAASYFLSQLSSLDKDATATNLATTPSYKDLFNVQVNRTNAEMAHNYKQQDMQTTFKFKDYQLDKKNQHDFEIAAYKGDIEKGLAAYRSALRTDEERRAFNDKWTRLSAVYGKDTAFKMLVDSTVGGQKTGGKESDQLADISKRLETALKLQKSDIDNGGDGSAFQSQIDDLKRDYNDISNNNIVQPVSSLKNSDDAYSQATKILELAQQGRFDRPNQPLNRQGLYYLIEQYCGGYAQNIIDQWNNDKDMEEQLSMFPVRTNE